MLIRRIVKSAAINSRFHWLVPESVVSFLERIGDLSRMSYWIRQNPCSPLFPDRHALYEYVLRMEGLDTSLDYLEFGVSKGVSLKWWVSGIKHPDARFVGFDTFEGLPEPWGANPKGTFTADGRLPDVKDERISYEVGLFQQTLPDFLKTYEPQRRKLIHMDSDLYTSTLYVLTSLAPALRQNDVIIFDEMGSVRNPMYEFRAMRDFFSSFYLEYTAVAATRFYEQVAIKLK